MRKLFIAILLAFLFSPSCISETRFPIPSGLFASAQEAAAHALAQSYKLSSKVEYGGAIYRWPNNSYSHSHPRTDDNPIKVRIFMWEKPSLRVMIAGMYHTHPCIKGYSSDLFSMPDVASALYWEVNSYLLDGCNGALRVFDPLHDAPIDFTPGRTFGQIPLTN